MEEIQRRRTKRAGMQNADELHLRTELRGHEEDVRLSQASLAASFIRLMLSASGMLSAGKGCDHLSTRHNHSLPGQNRQGLERDTKSELFTTQEPGPCLLVSSLAVTN